MSLMSLNSDHTKRWQWEKNLLNNKKEKMRKFP